MQSSKGVLYPVDGSRQLKQAAVIRWNDTATRASNGVVGGRWNFVSRLE